MANKRSIFEEVGDKAAAPAPTPVPRRRPDARRARAARAAERLRVACRGDPHRELALYRPRMRADLAQGAVRARECDCLAAPQSPHDLERFEHRAVARAVGLGPDREVHWLPARCDREAGATAAQVVDDRPVLAHAEESVWL